MIQTGVTQATPIRSTFWAIIALAMVASCGPKAISTTPDGPYAPGVDLSKTAINGVEVGHRLMDAGQYELAIAAFTRAALDQGLTAEILTGMGTASLGLGRLGQAETLLRRAVEKDKDWPEAWNNLGVVLMEQGEISEAQQVFRKAYALDDGQNDSIRENLRLALAKSENADNTVTQNNDYKLVQRGSSDYLIRRTP
ncbi:MAG: Flp pilus assembly protein TadD [Paracoccaceae bacterium]|jgi:Flp pilus assembly protein TadD